MSKLTKALRGLDRGLRRTGRQIEDVTKGLGRTVDDKLLHPLVDPLTPDLPKLPTAEEIAGKIPQVELPASYADPEARKLSIIQRIARRKKARGASLFGNLG